MSKNKVEDIIETFILNHFLTFYRNNGIVEGGDIIKAEFDALLSVKNMVALGSEATRQVVMEELRLYLDFHEKREGLLERPVKAQEMYIEVRDKQVDEKTKEIIAITKAIIKSKWNNQK